jgi:Zn-finger protein
MARPPEGSNVSSCLPCRIDNIRSAAETLKRATLESSKRHQDAKKEVLSLSAELQEVNLNLRTVYDQLR